MDEDDPDEGLGEDLYKLFGDTPPPGVTGKYLEAWRETQQAHQEAKRVAAEKAAQVIEPLPEMRQELVPVQGEAAYLLEHQLGSCAALINMVANYIGRSYAQPDVCLNFMDRIPHMLRSSAEVGRTIASLRGQREETCHRIVVERAERGEGDPRA